MKNAKMFYILLLFGLLFGSVSCTKEIRLNTQEAQEAEVSGNYTAIYYGCNFLNDLETIVILEKEGGKYQIEPYAQDFKFRVKKGLSAEEALETAKKSVNCNALFRSTNVKRILGPDGETIGYEVRPLYLPYRYGVEDVLDVDYRLKENKVVVTIKLRASMEMLLKDNKGILSDRDKDRGRAGGK
jgi:hypothetical protein